MNKPLDWSILPVELHYLIDPSMRFGQYQFEARILEYLADEMRGVRKRNWKLLHFERVPIPIRLRSGWTSTRSLNIKSRHWCISRLFW